MHEPVRACCILEVRVSDFHIRSRTLWTHTPRAGAHARHSRNGCTRVGRPVGGRTATATGACFRMANIKSQKKRILQNEKARVRNQAVRSSLKTAIRRFREAAEAGNIEQATAAQRSAARSLNKAVSRGVIHKNQAANRKSAIAKRLDELLAACALGSASPAPFDPEPGLSVW